MTTMGWNDTACLNPLFEVAKILSGPATIIAVTYRDQN